MKISALVIVALAVLVTAIRAASFDRVWSEWCGRGQRLAQQR